MHTQIALENPLFFQHVCSLWLGLRHLGRDRKAMFVFGAFGAAQQEGAGDTAAALTVDNNAYGLFPSST